MKRFRFLLALACMLLVLPAAAHAAAAAHAFGWRDGQFPLDGKPFAIRGGEMHFSRVPRGHWRAPTVTIDAFLRGDPP